MTATTFTETFKSLKVPFVALDHVETDSFANWALAMAPHSPIKSLVIKSSKGSLTHPIMIVSLESTAYSLGSLSKAIGAKEARVASDEVVLAGFVTPFAIVDAKDVSVYVDKSIFKVPDASLAFRAFSSSKSVLVKASDFGDFLKAFEESQIVKIVDFETLVSSAPAAPSKPKVAKESKEAKEPKAPKEKDQKEEKEVMIGLTVKKDEDFPTWYSQVLKRSEMMDYYDISGCYIIRPWAYNIWKNIQKFFGGEIEELGVEDCYFPMFVSEKSLNKEKDHIEGFSPEVAWVTKAGQSDLAEPIAVRPTSETVMYPYYSDWIQSHRDLPLRLNQWCNVVRWEFKHPQPFLRTREFLWQEGHTAFLTKPEAEVEVRQILELYRRVYEEVLAVPVVPGKKSEKEKFAGGLYTTTVEGFIPTTGRAIQGATSHCLGQNFSKMFDIWVSDEKGEKAFVWQNSWGLTTRTIGVMVMIHGDDKGLILPPRVASIQVIVIPVGITNKTSDETRKQLYDKAEQVASDLKKNGVRAKADCRDNYTPGYKYNDWELRGVPLRLEVGPRDVAANETRSVRRDNGQVEQLSLVDLHKKVSELMVTIQADMFAKAKATRDERLVRLETFDQFVETLNKKCMVLAPWCEQTACEDSVKARSSRAQDGEEVDDKAPAMGAKTLCIPFDQPKDGVKPGAKCFACESPAVSYTLWGRSY